MAALLSFLFLCLCVASISANSAPETFDLLGVERELMQNFRDYATELETKINTLNDAITEFEDEEPEATDDPELYLSNPLNAFKLVRHMHQDWVYLQLYMEQQVGAEQIEKMERLLSSTPQRGVALQQAAESLLAITKFYDFEPSSFITNGQQLSLMHLTALDFYHMGMELYKQHNYHEALNWLEVAADNYTTSPHNSLYGILGAPHWQVYESLSKVYRNLNLHEESLAALRDAIRLDPHNVHLLKTEADVELMLVRDRDEPLFPPEDNSSDLELQCRGLFKQDSELQCELSSVTSHYLEIGPLKLEEVLQDPYTLIYHDAIFPREIEHLKYVFEHCPNTLRFEAGGFKGCSIPDRYSPTTRTITTRIQDMTGLNRPMQGLHVFEYGLTEPFKLFKVFKDSTAFGHLDFNDIEATVIIFLKDVPFGGAITIPNYDIAVYPRQGDALVNFNEGDFEQIVCPHIMGTGLIIVKFLYIEEE